MNKLLTKAAKILVGLSLAAGVGVAVGSNKAKKVDAMPNNYTVSSSELSSVSNNQLVAWGTSSSNLVKSFGSNWGYLSTTKSEWLVFTVETTTGGFYLKDNDSGDYVYSSAAKKIELSSSNKTVLTLNNVTDKGYLVNGGSSIGNYTYNSTGIRPYSNNNYSAAHLYAVTAAPSDPSISVDKNSLEVVENDLTGGSFNVSYENTTSNFSISSSDTNEDYVRISYTAAYGESGSVKVDVLGLAMTATPVTLTISQSQVQDDLEVSVTVLSDNVVTVSAAGGATSLNQGSTLQLSASSSKGADTFTWASSDENIATVGENSGLVTGVGVGSVTITANSVSYNGTFGTKILTINFGGSYSRATWYNASALSQDNPSNTSADGSYVKQSFSGYSTTISSVSVSGTVAYDKAGGLSIGKAGTNNSYVSITMNSSYYLKSITIWGASWDAGILPTITASDSSDNSTTVTQLSNGGSFVSHGVAMNEFPLTWTFGSLAKVVTLSNGNSANHRFTIYQMDLVFSTINPESVSLSETQATLMQTETKQLTAFVSPRNYNTNFSISWSTTDDTIADVSETGLVSASSSNTGNVSISANYTIAGTTSSKTCSVVVIELVASSVNIRGSIADSLTNKTSETLIISGKTWNFSKVQKYALDYSSGGNINAYTKNCLRVGESSIAGSIGNDSAYAFKFKKVIVAHCLNSNKSGPYSASVTVAGSDTKGNTDVSATSVANGMITTYTLQSAVKYVNVSTTGATYISSVTFVFDNAQETAMSAAEFILGLSPDRGEEYIGSCSLANGTYKAAKKFLYDAGDEVKSTFQTSSDATIVSARTRYLIWAANNHDAAPFVGEEPSANLKVGLNVSNEIANNISLVVIISIISVGAIAGYFFIRKRKVN